MTSRLTSQVTARPTSPHPHFRQLARELRDPRSVQRFLRKFPYNREETRESLRSAHETLKRGRAHCLEAALLAAAILEHHGYPPLVMSIESIDQLDHVVFVFQNRRGYWGAVGRSRCEALHGRRPAFKTLRALALSYQQGFVDGEGRVLAFGLAHLDDARAPWRDSKRNVWKVERFLINLKHAKLPTPEASYRRWLREYRKKGEPRQGPHWW